VCERVCVVFCFFWGGVGPGRPGHHAVGLCSWCLVYAVHTCHDVTVYIINPTADGRTDLKLVVLLAAHLATQHNSTVCCSPCVLLEFGQSFWVGAPECVRLRACQSSPTQACRRDPAVRCGLAALCGCHSGRAGERGVASASGCACRVSTEVIPWGAAACLLQQLGVQRVWGVCRALGSCSLAAALGVCVCVGVVGVHGLGWVAAYGLCGLYYRCLYGQKQASRVPAILGGCMPPYTGHLPPLAVGCAGQEAAHLPAGLSCIVSRVCGFAFGGSL
jgi:hypothetical protein